MPTTISRNIIDEANAKAVRQSFGGNSWGEIHFKAFQRDTTGLAAMLKAWSHYADAHRIKYDEDISHDSYDGPLWANIGRSFLGLLNMELAGMDGGTLDSMIRDIWVVNGFDADNGEVV